MTEKESKELSKLVIENGNIPLTELQKEALKLAVDKSKNINELFATLLTALIIKK